MNKQREKVFDGKKRNMPPAFTERHLDKQKRTIEIYLPPTCSLSGAKLMREGKSLMQGLCPTENMYVVTKIFNIFLSGTVQSWLIYTIKISCLFSFTI